MRSRCALLLAVGGACACSNPAAPGPGPGGGSGVPSFVDCGAFADSRSAPYVLPFAVGQRVRVSRTFDHYTTRNGGVGLYAIDFDVPMRTPVHAIRGGTVAAVEERFRDDDHAPFHENWVMVRHGDGTVARYIHLAIGGALVDAGDRVSQGQVVGLSGNSGDSTGPHLHLDVQTCGPNLPPGYNTLPCGMTVPLSFRNTEAHACGLEPRQSYAAQPFVPEER